LSGGRLHGFVGACGAAEFADKYRDPRRRCGDEGQLRLSVPADNLPAMKLVSTRIITADVPSLVGFYELVTGAEAVWANELFAEIPTPVGTLAIGSDKTVPLFGTGSAEPAANRSAIIEFIVDDVDAEYERLRARLDEVVTEPTTMPWGNRALLFRDPDGNLVNLFTPVSDDAKAKFGV
jgi:predicted enzyme related to lactoylglutathione lyase